MADTFVLFAFTLNGDSLVGDRPLAQIVEWFRAAMRAAITLPGGGAMSFVGPVPKITRSTHANGIRIDAAWLVRFRETFWTQPIGGGPYADNTQTQADRDEAARQMTTDIARMRVYFDSALNNAIVSSEWTMLFRDVRVVDQTYTANIMGTVAQWESGEVQRSVTANESSVWNQIFGNPVNPMGVNPAPQPSVADKLAANIKSIVIWASVGVGVIYGIPAIARALEARDEENRLSRVIAGSSNRPAKKRR